MIGHVFDGLLVTCRFSHLKAGRSDIEHSAKPLRNGDLRPFWAACLRTRLRCPAPLSKPVILSSKVILD